MDPSHPRGGARIGLVVDTGLLHAYLDRRDRHHALCLELLANHPGPLVVPQLVVAETAHFAKRLGAEAEVMLLEDLASGVLLPIPVEPPDWLRMAELVWRYRDLPLGIVDASVVAAAERLGITAIATLDRRDFAAVRPAHVEAFRLLP